MNFWEIIVVIILATSINNWLIPLVIYSRTHGLFRKRPAGFVGTNTWGIIMDVILAGAINLATAFFYLTYGLDQNILVLSLIFAILATTVVHIWMAAKPWKVWIMPTPRKWNKAGYWHMISMTIQFAYGFYPIVLISQNPDLLFNRETILTLSAAGIFCLLFLFSLRRCNTGAKIGPIYISGEAW